MRIVVHAPVVEAPEGTEHVAAVVRGALEAHLRRLGAGTGAEAADEAADEPSSDAGADEPPLERPAAP